MFRAVLPAFLLSKWKGEKRQCHNNNFKTNQQPFRYWLPPKELKVLSSLGRQRRFVVYLTAQYELRRQPGVYVVSSAPIPQSSGGFGALMSSYTIVINTDPASAAGVVQI